MITKPLEMKEKEPDESLSMRKMRRTFVLCHQALQRVAGHAKVLLHYARLRYYSGAVPLGQARDRYYTRPAGSLLER